MLLFTQAEIHLFKEFAAKVERKVKENAAMEEDFDDAPDEFKGILPSASFIQSNVFVWHFLTVKFCFTFLYRPVDDDTHAGASDITNQRQNHGPSSYHAPFVKFGYRSF